MPDETYFPGSKLDICTSGRLALVCCVLQSFLHLGVLLMVGAVVIEYITALRLDQRRQAGELHFVMSGEYVHYNYVRYVRASEIY